MKPVIVLAFANDRDEYLPMIIRERKNIFKSLQTHHDNGYVQVHKEENTAVEDIFQLFNRYRDRIAIFHYGGHANGTHLQLETRAGGSQLANAMGLAQLMGQQEQLQLVFLNGCATLKQVDLLLSFGVRAVIATSVPIEDEMATEFAEQFYEALAGQAPVQKAFQLAKAFITFKYGMSKEIKRYSYRDVNWEGKEDAANASIPWGLYTNEAHPEVLDWKLPSSNRDSIIIRGSNVSYADDEINKQMVETLFNEIIKYGVQKPEGMDFRSMRRTVVDTFPVPVGEQLRLLFQSNTIDVGRLKQLVITYKTIIQFLCFTMLSELWDAKFKNPALVIHEDHLVEFNSFFALSSDSYQTFDYVKLIHAIAGIFEENKIKCFVEELSTFKVSLSAKDEFYNAHLFMEEMNREVFEDKVKANEIESFCIQAEEHLGTIIRKLAFFVKYKLTTIKTIEVIKPRHEKPGYLHGKVVLDRVSDGLDDEFEKYDSFTENNSVILFKNVDNVAEYLNLSPFFIDENAFKRKKLSKLFFYSHQVISEGKHCYNYNHIDNQEVKLTVSETNYPQVKEQFEHFKKSAHSAFNQ